jgi:signal transduction histidine kinase
MKLLNKTSIYYLLFALPVFAVCSVLLYCFVSSEIIHNLDESLIKEKIVIEKSLKTGKLVTEFDDEISFKKVDWKITNSKNNFSDTTLVDLTENELEPYRVLTTMVSNDKDNFQLRIRKSYIESDDLLSSILFPVLILFIVLLSGFFFINLYISKKLWTPFYSTLDKLKVYKVDDTSVMFEKSNIQEFSELNKTLTLMTEKIHNDYISQKQFIENASHEIQTPLAVIKSKIELLIQSKMLSESDMQIIQSVYNASNKLSSLNKALLLLSKIENNQFKDIEEIQFQTLIEKTITHFEDIISLKNIRVEKNFQSSPIHKMNPLLADILISNLIQNAIRHNIEGGLITIQLSGNSIIISNTSDTSIINTNELFQRFRKSEASAESIGLGLAIVKEICDKYNIELNYTCKSSIHTIQLNC